MDKLEIIKELMEMLEGEMGHTEDDISMRLGRKKPDLEVVSIEAEPMDEGDMMDEEDPGEMLKQRLAKLRG